MRRRRNAVFRLAAAAFLSLATAGLVEAQTGTISGRVVDGRTLQPVGAVQVFTPDLGIGVLSRSDGGFVLNNVPAGTHAVQAQRIGYRTITQQVTVAAGETVTANFSIMEDALALDAVVVTGTAGGTQQRAVGNVVGRVAAAEITATAPIQSMQDLIGSREPGLSFARSSGNVGTGSQIRIRGVSSLSMATQPLIYVDGVRVDNQGAAGPNMRDGRQVSKLDDFAPDQIESIEIIKGPAAATLYGTEASAGVINIITKKGASGAPQFDVSIRTGTTWLANASEKIGTSWGKTDTGEYISFNIWEAEKAAGRQFFDYGQLGTYSLSMRGGTDNIRYYLSADVDDNTGIVDYNWDRGLSTRANVTVIPATQVNLDVSMGYVGGKTSFMQQYTGYGVWEQAQWANPLGQDRVLRGFLRSRPEEIANIEAMRENSRFTMSGTLTYQPRDWFTHRLIIGTDVAQEQNSILFPRHPDGCDHDFTCLSLGQISVEKPVTRYSTFDYATSLQYGIRNDDIKFTTSFGAQYYDRFEEVVIGNGLVFPAPEIRTLGGAASTTATSRQVQNKSFGMYLQQEFNYFDRIFLTAAVRGDDNSAFGANYEAAIYPKVSATWVMSDEDFWQWDHIVNAFRLRGAWGKAGRQPDSFAAVTLFAPQTGPGGQPAVTPDLLGNPDLGPEVSTELEVGFEAALFDDKISTEVTYYTQKVNDALVNVPVPWSSGFPGSQSHNLGQLSNWGWEWVTDARVFDSPNFAIDAGFAVSGNQNRIDDMGGLAETNSMREGWNFPAVTRRIITNAEFNPDGTINDASVTCDGGTGENNWEPGGADVRCAAAPVLRYENGFGIPVHEGNFNAAVTLFNNLRIQALVDWQGEHYRTLTDASCRHTCFTTSELTVKRQDSPWGAAGAIPLAGMDGKASSTPYAGTYNSAFARLREISASYTLPESVVSKVGASRASLNLAARNLGFLYRAQTDIWGAVVHDPEARGLAGGGAEGGGGNVNLGSNSNVPPLTSFLVTLRASF